MLLTPGIEKRLRSVSSRGLHLTLSQRLSGLDEPLHIQLALAG